MQFRYIKPLFCCFFCFLLFNLITAQNPVYQLINDENGLPSNTIYTIVQDKNGSIWMGSDAGIYRYNGLHFTKYQQVNQKSSAVTGLAVSQNNEIYCYNFSNQIFYIKEDSLHDIKSWEGKREKGFANIAIGKDQQLYACSETALLRYHPEQQDWQVASQRIAMAGSLVADAAGEIWFGIEQAQVGNASGATCSVQLVEGSSSNMGEYFFCGDGNHTWLFSISGGFVYIKDKKEEVFRLWNVEKLSTILKNRKLTSVQFIENKLYICTYSGLVIYDPKLDGIELWYEKESFSRVLLDQENNLWLSTLGNGIYKIVERDFRAWNKQESDLPENHITDICIDGDSLIFSMRKGYIGVLDALSGQLNTIAYQLKSDIKAIFKEKDKIYFNTNGNLFCYENGQIREALGESYPVKKILKADDYYIICTSLGAFSLNELSVRHQRQFLNKYWVSDAAYQHQKLYLASSEGLFIGDFKSGQFQQTHCFFERCQVVALAADQAAKQLFALTFKGEIYECTGANARKIAVLPSSARVYDLLYQQGRFYLASNTGLWIFDETTQQWLHLDRVSGLLSNDINALAAQGQRLWLATNRGLQSIPLDYRFLKPVAKILLKKILVNDTIPASPNLVEMPYESSLSIALEAVAYASSQQFRFAYRISSKDSNWVFSNPINPYLLISGLPSGSFSIEIKAVDYQGRDSGNRIIINGYVHPPFWQRWWFYLLIAAAGMSLAYFVFWMRIKALHKKQMEKIEKIKLENELERSQQSALKAQMTPHFIFNVLNSIKSYIYANDKQNAGLYLTKFADLIRSVLNMSSHANIKLSEELHALDLYIQLEAMQLEPPFEYAIVLDENIDADLFFIPSLILQPFVENVFKHAFPLKKGLKKLRILVQLDEKNKQLRIEIDDNGIGRAAAEQLKKNKTYKAFATQASTKRLDLLNRKKNEQLSVLFIDKMADNTLDSGTTVLLSIPLLKR